MKSSLPHSSFTLRPVIRGWFLLLPLLAWLQTPVRAATLTVTSLADSGNGTLRDAIADANGNDTILITVNGLLQLTTGELVISKSLNILGNGAGRLTIIRGTTSPESRIFRIASSAGSPVSLQLEGMTVEGGAADFGGGGGMLFVGSAGSSLTLQRCAFFKNRTAGNGGGLLIKDATVSVRNSTIFDNTASQSGGGISLVRSNAVFENSSLFLNTAVDGAAIDLGASQGRLTGCSLGLNRITHVDQVGASCVKCNSGADGTAVLTLENSILEAAENEFAGNYWSALRSNPPSQIISHGYNLCSDEGVNLTGPGDQVNTVAGFQSGYPGGNWATPVITLRDDSAARDRGKSFGLTTDQRGLPRTRDTKYLANAAGGDGTDIGAVEEQEYFQRGNEIIVTTTDDHDDFNAGEFDCTLREALGVVTGRNSPESLITFAPGLTGTIKLDPALGALPRVSGKVHIAGPGARKLALSGELGVRPLLIYETFGEGSAISGLTLRNATAPGALVEGAGLVNLGGYDGTGILEVTDCAFTGNSATGAAGTQPGERGGSAKGGAVFNAGSLTLSRCSFTGNSANGGAGKNAPPSPTIIQSGGAGGDALGGAIFNDTTGVLAVNNCSFFTNSATGGNGGSSTTFGGGNGGRAAAGICNTGIATLTSCTITYNTGTGGAAGTGNHPINNGSAGSAGGGVTSTAGFVTVRNTICAGNTGTGGPDISGAFTSGGYNLIGKINGGSGFTAAGDKTGTTAAPLDPKLASLPEQGGPTDTLPPAAGSPALDAGLNFGLATDQRNLPRSYDAGSITNTPGSDGTDIGAVEVVPAWQTGPQWLSLRRVGPSIRIMLQGVPFTNYRIQASETTGGSYSDLGAILKTDSIGQVEVIDYGPLPGRRFYRAQVSP